jgi:hypothetical protein
MKKNYILSLALLVFCLILPSGVLSQGQVLYEDFPGPLINESKWQNREWVREIRELGPNDFRLVSKVGSPDPLLINSYPYNENNNLNFPNANTVNSIEADVTLLESSVVNSGETRARLVGRWYRVVQGAAGDATGDIVAEISLVEDSTGLVAISRIGQVTNPDGSTSTTIDQHVFQTAISLGTTYRLYIAYDSGANTFTFRVGVETYTVTSAGLPARFGVPNSPWKSVNTRARVNDSDSSAYVHATFGNINRNGSLYENFLAQTLIDPSRWNNYEFVREIAGGGLRSKTTSGPTSASSINTRLQFQSPTSIHVIQAKVTPMTYVNNNGIEIFARLAGGFFHDGTPGGGITGDIGAGVNIGGGGTSPVGGWRVWRFIDEAGNFDYLATGEFTTPISLGNTYVLSIRWNGSQFTFMIDQESATYTPSPGTTIDPPNNPWREIGTRIKDPAGQDAVIETRFDDVMVDGFEDCAFGYWAHEYVMALAHAGITGGCSQDPPLFCPDNTITRWQMAVFMEASLGRAPAPTCTGLFSDSDASTVGDLVCRFIEDFAAAGITGGCGDGRFCPNDPVTRAQMAVFIEASLGAIPSATCAGTFFDVNAGTVGDLFCRYIEDFATKGITGGCGGGNYCPNAPVTRAQMAVFLVAAPDPLLP